MSVLERFWEQVTRNGQAPCWACEIRPSEKALCRTSSGGVIDAHHVLPKSVLKREYPHGAYIYEDGSADRILAAHRQHIPRGAKEINEVRVVDLDTLLGDPRNGIPLGRLHHDRIERRIFTPTRAQLPESVEAFVAEIELGWWLTRTYGSREDTRHAF